MKIYLFYSSLLESISYSFPAQVSLGVKIVLPKKKMGNIVVFQNLILTLVVNLSFMVCRLLLLILIDLISCYWAIIDKD